MRIIKLDVFRACLDNSPDRLLYKLYRSILNVIGFVYLIRNWIEKLNTIHATNVLNYLNHFIGSSPTDLHPRSSVPHKSRRAKPELSRNEPAARGGRTDGQLQEHQPYGGCRTQLH